MTNTRKILIGVLNSVFRLLLFFSISALAVVLLYTNGDYFKDKLSENDVYNRFVDALIESNKDQRLSSSESVTLGDPEIRDIINEAFPPEDLQNATETIVDSGYSWLEGESPTFTFSLDLTKNKQTLATSLSDYAINRTQSLPICTEILNEIDPFSTNCQPPIFDFISERENLINQFYYNAGFLDDPIVTEKSLFGNESSINNGGSASQIPVYFGFAKIAPAVLLLPMILLGTLIIYFSPVKRKGWQKIGYGLAGTAFSLIFFTFVFSYLLPQFNGSIPILQSGGQGIDSLINDVALDFSRDYSLMLILISLPILIIGVAIVYSSGKILQKVKYKEIEEKAGMVNGYETKPAAYGYPTTDEPPIQSSELSDTKPAKNTKDEKYRTIPRKEL